MFNEWQPALLENMLFELETEEVISSVATDGRRNQYRIEDYDIEDVLAGKKAGGKQQRIAGQEKTDQQTGFAENDAGQNGIANPGRPAEVDHLLWLSGWARLTSHFIFSMIH